MIAKDWRGVVVFACCKRENATFHFQAKVEAIKWTLWLALDLDVEAICIEIDSKICVDALSSPGMEIPWRITCICLDILALKSQIPNCCIFWVARGANGVAHALANWSSRNNTFESFDVGFGPPYFVSGIKDEICGSSL